MVLASRVHRLAESRSGSTPRRSRLPKPWVTQARVSRIEKGQLECSEVDALTLSTYYNLDGTQQYISEPAAAGLAAEKVVTHYNSAGLPTDVAGLSGYLLGAAYSEIGQPQQFTLGTSAAEGTKKAYITNTWEEGTDRLKQSAVTDQTHNYELQELNYSYDDAGNVTSITDPTTLGGTGKADDQCFTYDGHQRLTEAWTPSTADCSASGRTAANLGGAAPYWTSYRYTDGGLRSTETSHTSAGDTTKTYCYGDTAHPHGLTATTAATSCTGVTATYAYDATGNTTGRPNGTDTQSLTWSPEGQLSTLTEKSGSGTTMSTTSHVYDADGTLLIRRNAGGETVLYLDDGTEVHLDTSTSTAKYWAQRYYNAGGQVIALRTNKTGTETLSWLAADQHGTSSLALDATSQAVTKRYTTPFGASRTGGTGIWPDDKAFLGKSADSSTSLTYVGAREYDPNIGRFLSVDPVLDTSDTQSLNGYTYADNSPVTQSDPTGLESCGPVHFCSGSNGTYGTYHAENDPGSKKYKGSSHYCDTHKCGSGTSSAPASDPVTIAPIPPRQFDAEAKRAWLDALHMVDKQNRMMDSGDMWDARNGIHLASETFWEVFCREAPGACPKSRPDAHNSTDFGYFPMTSPDSSGESLKDVLRGDPSAAAAGIWYRNLRPDEDPAEGLFAKNVDGDYTINVQIGQGSRVRTQWISVTKSWDVIKKWRQPGQRVAIIDGDKVEARLVDLTTPENRARYLRGFRSLNNAQSSQEALVERYINPNAIIGMVEDEE